MIDVKYLSDTKGKILVDDFCVALIPSELLKVNEITTSSLSIVCFNEKTGLLMWSLSDVKECKWWQKKDSFVELSEYFYIRPSDANYSIGTKELFKNPGFVRGITYQGFSYEISIQTGAAKYFDFHK
jgi:hypothetical protein